MELRGRVLLIHEGKLKFDGSPDELRKESSLDETFYKLTNYGRPSGQTVEETP